ncbi:lamin tail domain-containing protein [Haloterrigena salinisoli]|uniref:DUF7282 domain-containing protein n=1 Tax=Haloterrigena salinisoli TaxID=3132747 RepID=UPI0030CF5028
MNRRRGAAVAVLAVAALLVTSAVALPLLGGGVVPFEGSESAPGGGDGETTDIAAADSVAASQDDGSGSTDSTAADAADREPVRASQSAADGELVSFDAATESATTDAEATADADASASLAQEQTTAVEAGVDEGMELAQQQGVEVTQEQRAAAVEAASQSVAQHQAADAEQIQAATAGAVHGSLIQSQDAEIEQLQSAIGGATDGALAQSQTVSASQMQSATWGATHGALAQKQHADVDQIQVATRGAAAGACREAGDSDVRDPPKTQEAAQGAAYGVLEQYQKITVEQRQRITLEHVQHAAAGASAGALEGSTAAALEGEQGQEITVEQRQRVNIKQVQKAATGAAKGALVQRQEVTVEQTQAAARGAGRGSLTQLQTVSVEQVQRISISQIQEASFGAAKGSIYRSQSATVEQIQAAADGAAGGVLVQHQEISISQIQYAAVGASQGAIESAVQYQIADIQQIQAAAFGAGEGSVLQQQVVDITQVQRLASGGASGALSQYQSATVEQIQIAASGATQETARVVQYQRISVTQLQVLTQETASDATAYAVQQEIDDITEIRQYVEDAAEDRADEIDELEGTASITFADREGDGETVAVDEVDLSEGGFVAIYAADAVADPGAVLGTSSALEAGTHSDVEIDLEEPIEEDQPLTAVVHHDTNDDGTFEYGDTDGAEDVPYVTDAGVPVLDTAFVSVGDEVQGPQEPAEPNATLSVSDQTGDGETLTVDEASATVDYTVTATANESTAESQSFEANETVTDLELDLEPPLEANATVDVAVIDENGTPLENETVEYAVDGAGDDVADNADEAEGMLAVTDYEIDVGEGNAGDEYVTIQNNGDIAIDLSGWTMQDRFEDGVVDSLGWEPLTFPDGFVLEPGEEVTIVTGPGNDTADTLYWGHESPVWNTSSDEVIVLDEDEDVALQEQIEADQPNESAATLNVSDQTGDGETLVVDEANATVDYRVTATDENGTQRGESDLFEANETAELESLDLEPPLSENATLEVAVTDENDTALANESVEYTVDGDPATFEATFPSCSQAEVTGSFEEGDTIIVGTAFYESGGFGNSMGEYAVTVGEDVPAPFEGTLTYETGDDFTVAETADGATVTVPEGDTGAVITGFASPDATPGSIDHPNPNASECLEEIRPERPNVSVAETTPTADGIAVTFAYENPNNESLVVGSEFVEGTTADEPPSELEPGNDSFTVDWTPENDSERLVWEVDMSNYDYEEPLTAETPPAGEIDSTEPAAFNVSITEANGSVEAGEPLEVDAAIENTGGENGTQDVQLAIDGSVVNETPVSLEPGASESVTLTADTTDLEPGDYPVTVSSENETAETTVTIEEAEPAETPTGTESTTDGPADAEPTEEGPSEAEPAEEEPAEEAPTEAPAEPSTEEPTTSEDNVSSESTDSASTTNGSESDPLAPETSPETDTAAEESSTESEPEAPTEPETTESPAGADEPSVSDESGSGADANDSAVATE